MESEEVKIPVGGELYPVTSSHILGDASTIIDRTQNRRQDVMNRELKDLIDAKVIEAGGVSFDINPTENSTNPVTSGGIYTAFGEKQRLIDALGKRADRAEATLDGLKTKYVTEDEWEALVDSGDVEPDVEYNVYES